MLQADFELGITGQYVDSLGVTRDVTSFASPQRFSLNLDLDIANTAAPLAADSACVGGTNAGFACATSTECPGLKGDGSAASCDPMPALYRTGGGSFTAGAVGYFEGFEGAVNQGGRNFAGANPIPGTGVSHLPALHPAGGYLAQAVRDFILGGTGVLGGLTPGSAPGSAADLPPGSSATDGSRCCNNASSRRSASE